MADEAKKTLPPEVMEPLRIIYRAVGNERTADEDPVFALEMLLKGIVAEIPSAPTAILSGLLRESCGENHIEYVRRKRHKDAA